MAAIETSAEPFLAALDAALEDFDQTAEEIVGELGNQVAELAVGYAPHGATGELEGSIGATAGRTAKGPYVDVGTSLNYGFYQEFGTSKMPAHPFMRPALAQVGMVLRAAAARARLTGAAGRRRAAAGRRRAGMRQRIRRRRR